MAGIYFSAVIFNIPRFWANKIVYNPAVDMYISTKSALGSNWWFTIFYLTIVYYVLIFIVPTTVLVYLTYHLIIGLRKAKENRQILKSGPSSRDLDLTLTLITVVIVFVICNSVNPTVRVLLAVYGPQSGRCPHFLYPFMAFTATVHIFNASINMILYVLFGKTFRKRFSNFMCCRNPTVGPTRTTGSEKQQTHARF